MLIAIDTSEWRKDDVTSHVTRIVRESTDCPVRSLSDVQDWAVGQDSIIKKVGHTYFL